MTLLSPRRVQGFQCPVAGSQREELRPWQRSWGRRLSIRKGRIEPQESPWKFSSIYPQNQSLPTSLLCALTYTSDFTGGCPPTTSLWKRVNLQLQLIKFLGMTRVFQPTNSFGSPLACLNRFFRPHVIVQSLPTVRGMRCSKLSKYRFLWAIKILKLYWWRVFHLLGQCLLLSFHIPYLLCPWDCID